MSLEQKDYCFDITKQCSDTYDDNSSNNGIKWKKLLGQYKTTNHDPRWVYMYSNVANIIYDKYPKSLIHLLVLPFSVSYVDKDTGKIIYANKPSQFKRGHRDSLKVVHNLCKIVAKNLMSRYNVRLKIGYHLEPTMDDLHIHIISDDFSFAKNKNQRKSFSDKNFITIDEVDTQLLIRGSINYNKKIKYEKYDDSIGYPQYLLKTM